MPDFNALAFSLSQNETGWRWSVYDEDGVTVANGADPSQADARAAVERTMRQVGQSYASRN